mmetsp:Transcript_35999/g.85410  ORF Transcript_35999/g.85410 Transcript_35999/m.85410 type:complete len:217 (+) Transcript_35999:267-917(+)
MVTRSIALPSPNAARIASDESSALTSKRWRQRHSCCIGTTRSEAHAEQRCSTQWMCSSIRRRCERKETASRGSRWIRCPASSTTLQIPPSTHESSTLLSTHAQSLFSAARQMSLSGNSPARSKSFSSRASWNSSGSMYESRSTKLMYSPFFSTNTRDFSSSDCAPPPPPSSPPPTEQARSILPLMFRILCLILSCSGPMPPHNPKVSSENSRQAVS